MIEVNVVVSHVVGLDKAAVEQVFRAYLEKLKDGRWVYSGKLWEEHATSHRYEAEIGGPSHPDYELVETVQKLERLLKERRQ